LFNDIFIKINGSFSSESKIRQGLNKIEVVKLGFEADCPLLADVAVRMDNLGQINRINKINWDGSDYKPEVYFKIAYGEKEIYLKYYVREEYVKAEMTGINQNVYEDSCVEFFVSPEDDGIYYNFEFNSIGAFLLGSGSGRQDRIRINPRVADRIRCLPSMGYDPFAERRGEQKWTLTVAIHLDMLFRHDVNNIKDREFRANFYKCGDGLTRPHYLSWNPVLSEKPDFHRPEYFGIIHFK